MMEHEKVKLPRPIYNVLKAQGFSIHGIKRDKAHSSQSQHSGVWQQCQINQNHRNMKC